MMDKVDLKLIEENIDKVTNICMFCINHLLTNALKHKVLNASIPRHIIAGQIHTCEFHKGNGGLEL
jgi:hypothetical protein